MKMLLRHVCDPTFDGALIKATTRDVGDEAERLRAWLRYQRRELAGCYACAPSAGPSVLKKPPEDRLWNPL
eukprot:2739763-Prymnesium_polylepis.1